jgi:hypothetical protein
VTAPLHHPARPDGIPVLGLTDSEESRDFWDDLDGRSTLQYATADIDAFPPAEADQCLDLLPGRSTCSRAADHAGRHVAVLDQPDGTRTICSAWPGTHRPTLTDLRSPTMTATPCTDCSHTHTGPSLASICIGCPCETRPGPATLPSIPPAEPFTFTVREDEPLTIETAVYEALGAAVTTAETLQARIDSCLDMLDRWATSGDITSITAVRAKLTPPLPTPDLGGTVPGCTSCGAALDSPGCIPGEDPALAGHTTGEDGTCTHVITVKGCRQ